MADNGSDVFADEAEASFTMDEYIEAIEAQELEADLVLGGDEGKECTYAAGYRTRQAVFSCLTCVPAGNAGVCTACSLNCHEGHEVVELWTKRKFRCDCGNSKFGGHLCKLCPDKDSENTANSYNHNFKGSYCTCDRPYPDPEAKEEVQMIQCCICEDWFHDNHVGLNSIEEIPLDEDGEPLYDDFICHECSPICSFLKLYPNTLWASIKQNSVAQADKNGSNVMEGPSNHDKSEKHENCVPLDNVGSEKTSTEDNCTKNIAVSEKANLYSSGSGCKLGADISTAPADSEKTMPFFMCRGWRDALCRCEKCVEFYARQGIAYLVDKEDSISEYEKIGKQKRLKKLEEQQGAETKFLNSLGHIEKIEIFSGINDMKNELQSFLESHDPSEPITSEDVRDIFKNLSKKRQRLS